MADLKRGWFCDHAPGRGKILSASLVGAAGKYYFEFKVVSGSGGNNVIFVGVGGLSFQETYPNQFDVSPPPPSTFANCAGFSFKTSSDNATAWGYPVGPAAPGSPGGGGFPWYVGIAVDTVDSFMWFRYTANPNTWFGAQGAGTVNPVTVQGGFDISVGGVGAPITGNIYAVIGGGNEASGSSQDGIINFGNTGFQAAAPTGFSAWDTSTVSIINPVDTDSHITLAASDLEFTGITAVTGSNQPGVFGRSNTSKSH